MKSSKSFLFGLALTCAAFALSLAVCAQAQTMTTLATLNSDGADGNGPFATVIQATDGNFYGTADIGGANGGSYGDGTLFRMKPTGELTVIYNFCSQTKCADGESPTTAPLLGSDGNLYGVTIGGGSNTGYIFGSGTVYKMTLDGKITILHAFCATLPCTDGQAPTGIVQGSDGNFYGSTTVGGNSAGAGTIFSISPTGTFKVLYTFCSRANCLDGAGPYYPPILGNDGNFYGVTYTGGNQGGGVLFELTAAGDYKVLYNFCGASGTCSSNPFMVVRDSSGNFFGTTARGSRYLGNGTVFELTSTNQYIVLHNFSGYTGPTWPYTGLTLANDGNIYGVTGGGINNAGSIFEITPAGVYTTLFTFLHNHGSEPPGPLFQGTDGSFYGTTTYGPGSSDGSVFRLSNGLSPLVETAPGAGKVGHSVIILGNGLTGSTSVTFNGVAAAFTVKSDTYIKATVPAGATTGSVSVVTPSGTLNSNPQFVVTK